MIRSQVLQRTVVLEEEKEEEEEEKEKKKKKKKRRRFVCVFKRLRFFPCPESNKNCPSPPILFL